MDDHRRKMEAIARQLAGLSEAEQAEVLLAYFVDAISDMDTPTLLAFKKHCHRRSEGTEVENAMLDILDGQLALREIFRELPSDSPGIMKRSPKPATIDQYLAPLSPDKRAALEKLRKAIRAAVPKAEECISYGIPAFRLNGKFLVGFGAAVGHCAFYPGGTVEAFADELRDYDTSKGTIRFQPDRPIPATLVRKLVRTRIAAKGL